MLVTFRVKNIVSFCVKKLLHFALKSCYILRQKLLHFGLMLHFASKVVTFRVNVTFCVNCYILRRNRGSPLSSMRSKRFCAVKEQRTRNKSQRPREKWRKQKSGEGVGKKEEGNLSSPPPPPSFIFWFSFHFSRGQNQNLPLSFFAPKPNGNACYAGHRL